ncbi:MAG: hypothetical protein IT463_05980 [Planctomycetes bacterium]|nr:hypothetical protein [Planctomycetota bacterium]
MKRLLSPLLGVLLLAPALSAQAAPKEGDLVPRDGTIMYMVSDRPDALYRLFGTDAKGNWRLRALAQKSLDAEAAKGMPEEEAREGQAVLDFIFNSYESLAQVEIALVDATLDGPKYLAHLKAKPGKPLSGQPEFLKSWLNKKYEYRDVGYLLYRLDNAPAKPGEGEGAPEEAERQKQYFGMNRYYVAEVGGNLLIANFESTIRESIDRWLDKDYSESLSARAEFSEWKGKREPHDLSVFVIGKEIQNLIERVMPSKDQVGVDTQKIYSEVDSWLNFREYRYIVCNLDYDTATRGFTMSAELRTRRQTKLLEKLAIAPGKFNLLKYVPKGTVVVAGAQLGEPKDTYNNLLELARDAEQVARAAMPRRKDGGSKPPEPGSTDPKKPVEPPKKPGSEEDWLPKSMGPVGIAEDLAALLKAQAEGEDDAEAEEEPSEVDGAIEQAEEMLKGYGTSLDEVLSVLGTEVVFFVSVEENAAVQAYRRNVGDIMDAGTIGLLVALKDPKKAETIIAAAREKDPEGIFGGLEQVGYEGTMMQVSSKQPYGYAVTGDALLIAACMDRSAEDCSGPVIACLKAMLDSAKRTTTGKGDFIAEGSKFVHFDMGLLARLEKTATDAQAKRLDRYARPPVGQSLTADLTDLTFTLRTREAKDGVEVALRVAGLPDLGAYLDSESGKAIFEGGGSDQNSLSYSEENLRTLGRSLRDRANKGVINIEEMLKAGDIRAGLLQSPFDAQWKGDRGKLGWITLDQVQRDEKGELPKWVDKAAAEQVESNEKAAFRSFRLADGNVTQWMKDYATGFIVVYQEKADSLGGHLVLYADGQVGWISGEVFAEALKLNAEGKPVPAADRERAGDSQGALPKKPDSGREPAEARTPRPAEKPKDDADGISRPAD